MKYEIIYIDGFWIDTKEKFENYKCIISKQKFSEDEEGYDVFYQFETVEEVNSFKQTKGRTDNEFVITKITKG